MVVLFENDSTLVVNKPSGLLVHPDGSSKEETLIDWILLNRPEIKGVGETERLKNGEVIERPGIVHRLDRETSGALLIAKNPEAHAWYKNQFQEHLIRKTYLLFTQGTFKEKEGVIDKPIGKSRSDFRKWSAEYGARGLLREAVTEYKVIEEREGVSLVEAYPKTGRTHQIRVHFKAIGKPLVKDSLYAPKQQSILGFNRLALHALSLEFNTLEGEYIKVKAPLPEDFLRALESLSIDSSQFL